MTINEVFQQLDQLQWSDCIYLPPGQPTLGTPCIVHDPDDVEPGQEVPDAAESLGYVEGLGVDDLQSVRENARLQGRGPTAEEFLQAFTYYLQNDAFITFG
jgi:hypothetical protein